MVMDGRDQARAPSGDERYQHLLDRLPCGVARCRVITDRDGRVDFVFDHASRRFEALTGLHDLVGQPLSAVVPGAAAAEPDKLATCARLALDGGAERFEIHVAAARRSFRAEVYGSALVITRRTDRRIVDANDRYMRMIGYHRDEVIGKTGLELGLVSPEIFRERQVELERMFATASERELESELRTRSGNRVIVHASIEAIDLPDEGPCLLTTLLDVTARRRAEEAFYQAFHAGPAGMLLIRVATSAAVEVNDSLLAMTGARRDTLLAEVPGALLSVMQPEPGPGGAATARELELTDAAGRAVTLLASTATIEIGDEPYRLGLFVDITDRKRAERRLALQHALSRALTELHEFNTALPRVLDELCRGDDWEFAACWLVDAADGTLRCYATSSAHDPASDALVATVRGMSIAPGAGFVGRVVATGALISTAIDHASFLQPEVALACGLRSATSGWRKLA
jgi:PAS domain S-box-containing protein